MSAAAHGGRAHGGRARRRAGATALTAAVIGGLLGSAPTVRAAPAPEPDGAPAGATDRDTAAQGGVPSVWPRPQTLRAQGAFVPVGRDVSLVSDKGTDSAALDALRTVLRDAGARTVHEVRPGQPLPGRGLVVRAGGSHAADALR
ncbi:MAG: glycoside hydrolase family 20 zincin-like fold domain-containing protein, partial [Streptomyces sp.]